MKIENFKAESKRLLDLMINSIYTHKEIFLREIISNSADALDKLHFISLTDDKARTKDELCIKIEYDKTSRILKVSDNGIGMTSEEMEENLGTIAKSGSYQFKQEVKDESKPDIIGQFGVGFYSAFMVADKLTVISKKYNSEAAFKWESEGAEGYTIDECKKDSFGTEVIIHIKEDTDDEKYSEYLDQYRLTSLIKKYSDYIHYPIKMNVTEPENVAADGEEPKFEQVTKLKTINSMVPIWRRNKSEVSDEECMAYYKDKFFDMSDPISVIRINADGAVSYKAMLFIPGSLPYNYYTKAYEKGLQLYSNGVLIMDRCEKLLPDYFSFVKGIVDSSDLSLNISRELLQHDRQLSVIAKNIEKKIKTELKKLLTNDKEKYNEFWKNFGTQIKFSICGDFSVDKDNLKDLVQFLSSDSDKYTTFSDYITRMKEGQKYIYYACGDSIPQISALPQMELCREKGYEVLYFTEQVDEFVVKVLEKFDDKEFKSITAEDAELQSDEKKKEIEEKQESNKDLLTSVTEALSGKVIKTVISQKLKNYPVCLSSEGPISFEVEKYYAQINGQEKPKAQKVFEINGDHEIFNILKNTLENDKEKFDTYVDILYNQALLIAGFQVEDPSELCKKICGLIK